MIPLLIISGLVLLSVPGLVSVRKGHPAHWTRNALAVLLTGFALVVAGLLLWAAPAWLDLLGATELARVCRRMLGGLAPGGWQAGATAGIVVVVLAGMGFGGAWRVRRIQRRMRVESWLGVHERRGDHDLVVVPTADLLAYAVGGRPPQVVVSQGLLDRIDGELTEAVCAHEVVHARYGHDGFIAALAAVAAAFAWFPPTRWGVANVRLALERWADEEAGAVAPTGRQGVRSALLEVAWAGLGPEVASFGPVDTISERAEALSDPPPRPSRLRVVTGYVAVWVAALVATGSLAWATGMSILAVTNPGLCVL
ncbi:MAG: M48 family metalloprotease [Acidimicrobiia bacterium]|nr:M48 family metalloprotease [Acidimicrobiia bacterium]